MKLFAGIIAYLALTPALLANPTLHHCENPSPLATVPYVDLDQYLGVWYEIAAIPQPFERGCYASQANYESVDDSTITVTNSCRLGDFDGPTFKVEGTASVVDASQAKLEVSLMGNKGAYWIIELDEQYQWAVVGTPDRNALWILSRTRQLNSGLLDQLLDDIEQKHCYDVSRIETTPQPELM